MTEPEGTSPGTPEEAASGAPEPAQAEPVWTPENTPSWLSDAFAYLHGRIAALESKLGL